MKRMMLIVVITLVALSAFALKRDPEYLSARRNGAEMKMNLRVVDDAGDIVSNAAVRVLMGMNFRERCYFIDGMTDTNGLFVIEGKTAGDEVVVDIEKDGYYKTHKKYCFITMGAEHEVKDGKWQPYGAEERLELRRIRNPKNLINYWTLTFIPETNVWIGVDMQKKSFVVPYGTGEHSDFEIRVDWDGLPPAGSKYCVGYIRFCQSLSGGYYAKKIQESSHPYPYDADADSLYLSKKVKVANRSGGEYVGSIPFNPDAVLVMRTRCQVEGGRILKANYGFIELFEVSPEWDGKPSVRLSYVFNPTPNDTNLEAKQ